MRERSQLARQLGLLDATAIVVGGIIGSGIFISPAIVAREVGAPGLALGVWVAAGMIAACGALCYAELGASMPQTGGTYVYLQRAYRHPIVAFLFGWGMFWASFTGAIAAVATAFAHYAGYFLEGIIPYGPGTVRMVAVTCILFLTVVNCLSLRLAGRINVLATALKLLALIGVIVAGLLFGRPDASHFTPLLPAARSASSLIAGFGVALIPAVFAFNGWSYASYVGGEITNPHQNLPRSILLGLGVCAGVYLLANVAYLAALPFDQLRSSPRVAADAMVAVVGPRGGAVISLGILISTFGAANSVLLSCSRTYFAMARNGLFFQALERVHDRFKTPANAILAQGIVASLLALSGTFEQILTYVAALDYVFYILVVIGLFRLRLREPDLPRPYRVWGYPLTPMVFIAAASAFVVSAIVQRTAESMVGLGLMVTGVPFYLYWSRRARNRNWLS